MELELETSDEDRAFRESVRAFLDIHLPEGWGQPAARFWSNEKERIEFLRGWQRTLRAHGMLAITWPSQFGGRDATLVQQLLYNEEMSRQSVPDVLLRSAINQVGPVLIQWGTQEQKDYFLPRILNADDQWCQGFSEPDAGSDLASLKTRAVGDGDDLVVTGTKVWTSRAEYADWCLLLARTDPAAPKHRGITCVIVDMHSPGVTVRPLRQIHGASGFNQVFFEDVRVPRSRIVGALNDGWRVATQTLRFERAGMVNSRAERRLGIITRMARETSVDGVPRIKDPVIRERLVRYSAIVEALRLIGIESLSAGLQGHPSGPAASIAKLLWSETDQSMADFGVELLGPFGILQVGSAHAQRRGHPATSYLLMRAATIGGGTSEIQRNIIGEHLLGLPKD